MRRLITATVLACTMGLAPAAQADRLLYRVAPTQQNPNQTGQILGGIAALGALGFALNRLNDDDDDDDKRRVRDHRRDRDDRGYRDHRRDRDDRHRDGRGWRRADVLPANCLRSIDNRRGPDRVFGAHCLARNGVEVRRLPRQCRTDVYARGSYRPAFAARCLGQQGWRVARHR